ncbi:MAG: hypothetical protein H5T96_00475 [Tissierellales bacterium]|nr:hypothetical protein [Tissierellales bacterium]
MESIQYIDFLKERLSKYYDITENYMISDINFEVIAKCNVISERYFFTKGAVIDSFNTYEYYLIKTIDTYNLDYFKSLLEKIITNLDSYEVEENHMRTIVNLVFLINENSGENIENFVKKFRYSRNIKFGLKGWIEASLVLVNLKENIIISNKKGKDIIEFLKIK